jgi:hypothetical protein
LSKEGDIMLKWVKSPTLQFVSLWDIS